MSCHDEAYLSRCQESFKLLSWSINKIMKCDLTVTIGDHDHSVENVQRNLLNTLETFRVRSNFNFDEVSVFLNFLGQKYIFNFIMQ